MAADLFRFGVMTSAPGSVSGGRADKLKPDRFPPPALPSRAEVRAAAADSILLAIASLISYWLTTRVLSLVYGDSPFSGWPIPRSASPWAWRRRGLACALSVP